MSAHVGTTDIDLVIGLALADETSETYETLQKNLEKSGFKQEEPSYQWTRKVEGITVAVEFLCETDQVPPSRIFRPKALGEFTGPKLGAFNVRGALLVRDDFIECDIEGERLDDGGESRVTVRVAGILPYTVLKTFAFQDRHENKDSYDLVFTLLNYQSGPREAGAIASKSAVADDPLVEEALKLLEERFRDARQDGPSAHAAFLAAPDDEEGRARLREQAVATVREFLRGYRDGRE